MGVRIERFTTPVPSFTIVSDVELPDGSRTEHFSLVFQEKGSHAAVLQIRNAADAADFVLGLRAAADDIEKEFA